MRLFRIHSAIGCLVACLALLAGCDGHSGRMENPESPSGRYSQQIAVGRQVLDKKADWGDRAEWEVVKTSDGWKVTAWRVEHREAKGAKRYVPWGYAIIELDRNLAPMSYRAGR